MRTRRRPGSASLSCPDRRRLSDWIANGQRDPARRRRLGLVRDRGRCRRLRSRPRHRGTMWTRRRNAGTSGTARHQEPGPRDGELRRSQAAPRRRTLLNDYPPGRVGRRHFATILGRSSRRRPPARGDHKTHGRLHEALSDRPRARGLAHRPPPAPRGRGPRRRLRRRRRAVALLRRRPHPAQHARPLRRDPRRQHRRRQRPRRCSSRTSSATRCAARSSTWTCSA